MRFVINMSSLTSEKYTSLQEAYDVLVDYVISALDTDTAFFKKNTNIRAHEFHYSKADKRGDSCEIKKYSGKCWNGLYAKENIMAGYPHFYFHNCREVAERFVDMAEKISKNLSM